MKIHDVSISFYRQVYEALLNTAKFLKAICIKGKLHDHLHACTPIVALHYPVPRETFLGACIWTVVVGSGI